jgi:hypothetical protein
MNHAAARSVAPVPTALTARPSHLRRPVSLSEVLDRVLTTGAVLTGEIVISVAGVDLLYLAVNLLVSSVETVRNNGRVKEPSCESLRHM